MNCFKHCGVQPITEETTEDPFADLDQQDEELEELVQQLGLDMPLTTTEHVAADEDVATCATFENSANWRQELRDMVVLVPKCQPLLKTRKKKKVIKNFLQIQSPLTMKLSIVAMIY